MYETYSTWIAVFNADGEEIRTPVEAWDDEGFALIVNPNIGQLIRASETPGFVKLIRPKQ